ncbi:MAG: hypothetical protein EBR81_07855 [Proteobacteria bacterium]|nr:hypothetical protein [Pseudomonadota bacterium]
MGHFYRNRPSSDTPLRRRGGRRRIVRIAGNVKLELRATVHSTFIQTFATSGAASAAAPLAWAIASRGPAAWHGRDFHWGSRGRRLRTLGGAVGHIKQVSNFFVKALLAREDTRFYKHAGVDPIGILRAVARNLVSHSAAQGASTLTQQLARNSYPLGGKNLHRKILEAFVAFRIEKYYSKDEILEHYMNRIYLGAGVYGIETASLAYFNKHAADLNLGEAALLAGIIRGPSRFSPVTNFQGALRERDTVLERLVKLEVIPQKQADAAKEVPIVLNPRRRLTVQENYAMDSVLRELSRVLSEDQLSESGLRIYTTLDPALQDVAQTALDVHLTKIESQPKYAHPKKAEFTKEAREAELDPAYLQGAVVVLDNRTGGIRALVGGRDYADSRYNRALLSQRPIGSTFKPFVYLAAFARGLSPEASISDGPIQRGEVRSAPNWSPGNSDGTFKGSMSAEDGLIQSRNTVTVRVGEQAGLAEVGRIGAAVGLDKMPQRPSAYLGAFEASLMRVTNAYTQAGPCAMVTGVLSKVLDRGTASTARAAGFKKIAAGKTGTTDDYKDAWFVGFTSSLTAGVWVGFDRPQRTVSQGYGATMALPVWVEVMNAAPESRYPASALRTSGDGGSYRPPAVVPATPQNPSSPPRVEPVQPQGNPPRVEPVLKPFKI